MSLAKEMTDYLARIDSVIQAGPYQDNWESLAAHPMPAWYEQAKFGVFIHWGVYSVPAYFSEWYCRLMYYKGNPVYWHHKRKYGKTYPYRAFIQDWKAEQFDAASWVRQVAGSGAAFMMPVAEHHDGFKLYDSSLSKWTSVNMGPQRDIMGELKTACADQSFTFSASSHRAEHYWFLNGGRTVGFQNETQDEAYRDLYGPCVNVHKRNNLVTLLKQEHGITPTQDWLEDWLVSSCELIDRYQPASLFFDWWVSHHAFRPYMKKFLAYYYNQAQTWGKEVCVYYKSDAAMYNCAVFDRERGQLESVSPYLWQGETSTAYNAWSYCTTNRFKKPAVIACNLLDVVSKNGCFVLNIGPKADGTICPEEQHILQSMGEWTRKNHEGIWGTGPYKVYGEGKKQKAGSFHEKYSYTARDYRFTYRTGVVYAFALSPKGRRSFSIRSLADSMDLFHCQIVKITMLGSEQALEFTQTKKALKIKTTNPAQDDMPVCFKIEVE